MFSELAQVRLAALRRSTGGATTTAGQGVGGTVVSASGTRTTGAPASVSGTVEAADAQRPAGVMFRPDPDQTCASLTGAACWMEVSQRPGCYVWNPLPEQGETVTWTAECARGLVQGTGTLRWVHDERWQTVTGRRVDGKPDDGHMIIREEDNVSEGPYVNGERHGNFVIRWSSGTVEERRYVNGVWVR